jgi:hypothetical protein
MKVGLQYLGLGFLVAALQPAFAQSGNLHMPKTVQAGSAFSIESTGSGKAVLYIVGPVQALRRDVQLGEPASFPPGTIYNAGHYLAILTGPSSTEQSEFDVVPENKPAALSFLARPSRISVSLHNGITGAVYVFDAYQNLITAPMPVSFQLSGTASAPQTRTVNTRDGAAWTQMDSASKEGAAKFVAQASDVSSSRIIQQVPGDPCGLRMTARPAGEKIELQTDPVRDCSGNAVPDGTIVTFTENYNGTQSTVDVPLKRGIAKVEMPAHDGARISAATGVVLGNEVRWGKQ